MTKSLRLLSYFSFHSTPQIDFHHWGVFGYLQDPGICDLASESCSVLSSFQMCPQTFYMGGGVTWKEPALCKLTDWKLTDWIHSKNILSRIYQTCIVLASNISLSLGIPLLLISESVSDSWYLLTTFGRFASSICHQPETIEGHCDQTILAQCNMTIVSQTLWDCGIINIMRLWCHQKHFFGEFVGSENVSVMHNKSRARDDTCFVLHFLGGWFYVKCWLMDEPSAAASLK